MSTLRQIEANRRNAQKSTGPTSVTGKAASSMNALKTGIHAKSLVLPTENLSELEELVEDSTAASIPPPPKPAALSTSSSTANGTSAASAPPKPNPGNTRITPHSAVPISIPSDFASPHIPTPSPDSSTAWTPPAAPANAPSSPSNNSRPKPPPPPRPTRPPDPARTRESPVPIHLDPNHFPHNWLRSANPLESPGRTPESQVPTTQSPSAPAHPFCSPKCSFTPVQRIFAPLRCR